MAQPFFVINQNSKTAKIDFFCNIVIFKQYDLLYVILSIQQQADTKVEAQLKKKKQGCDILLFSITKKTKD